MRTLFRSVTAACVLLLAAAVLPSTAGAAATTWRTATWRQSSGPNCGPLIHKPSGGYWTCTFDDDFSGSALDAAKWTAAPSYLTGHSDSGRTCYTTSTNNVSVADGTLNLTIRKEAEPYACTNPYTASSFTTTYTSGEVTTASHFSQAYGRFEVRALLPTAAVAGLNETFWLWPNNQTYGSFPASGEIDFAQGYSAMPTWSVPALHYNPATAPSWPTNTNTMVQWPPPYNQPGSNCTVNQGVYNTFTVIWKARQITILVNGNSCLVDNYSAAGLSGAAPFNLPFFMVLTQALDGGTADPTLPFPQTTRVDYVRIWK